MKFIFQKKSLIISVIFLIFSCVIFLFIYGNINNNEETSQLAQEKWQTEVARRENEKFLVNSIETIEPERALLETHFVQSSDVVPFLNAIEKLAREVGVKAEVASINAAKDDPSLEVKIQVSGSFEMIYKLIMLLENSPFSLEFTLADIQNTNAQNISANRTNKNSQWTAVFQMKLLSFVNK